jgi:hypothetical protein
MCQLTLDHTKLAYQLRRMRLVHRVYQGSYQLLALMVPSL